MNFKGTTNIPREKVKGIIEEFGGSWNGYTWIDQTTYLETADARRARPHAVHRGRADGERPVRARGGESERTVIISELEGGENDPDQLLEMEVNAAAFKAHPYGHPTIGWLSDLQRMTRDDLYGYYRRYYVPNNATLVVVGDVDPDDVLRRADAPLRPRSRRATRAAAPAERRAAADGRAARDGREGRDDRVPEAGVPRAGGHRRRLLPAAGARRRADRREGAQPLVELPDAAAAAQRAALPRARRGPAGLVGLRRRCCRRPIRSSTPSRSPRREGRGARGGGAALRWPRSTGCARGRSPTQELEKAKNQLRARLVFENDSVTNIAHQLGYFETIASVDLFLSLAGADRGA